MGLYTEIIIPSGSIFNNAKIKGFGNVDFKDAPQNPYDNGARFAPLGSYQILSIVDRSTEDMLAQPSVINGFTVRIGTTVNIALTKDVRFSIPNQLIEMTGNAESFFLSIPTPVKVIGVLTGVALVIVAIKFWK